MIQLYTDSPLVRHIYEALRFHTKVLLLLYHVVKIHEPITVERRGPKTSGNKQKNRSVCALVKFGMYYVAWSKKRV